MPGQQRAVSEMVSAMGFRRFTVSNDSYLGIKTQSAGWGDLRRERQRLLRDGHLQTGEMLQIGGHNDLTGDRGGGSYLVPAAVRAAYAQLFKGGAETAITGALMDWLGVGRREDFCEALAVRLMGDAAERTALYPARCTLRPPGATPPRWAYWRKAAGTTPSP